MVLFLEKNTTRVQHTHEEFLFCCFFFVYTKRRYLIFKDEELSSMVVEKELPWMYKKKLSLFFFVCLEMYSVSYLEFGNVGKEYYIILV